VSKICHAARLAQHFAAVLGVGVVAEVRSLVDEALTVHVDHDAQRVAELGEPVPNGEVAEVRGVLVPEHGVPARPLAPRLRVDLKRHPDAVTGVEPRAAHLGDVPARSQVASAHLGVGLETAAGEDDGAAAQLERLARAGDSDPAHSVTVSQQRQTARLEPHLGPVAVRGGIQGLDEPGAASPGVEDQAAPEGERAVHLERLPAVGDEADALAPEPVHGVEALRHEHVGQLGVGAVVRHLEHVLVELVLRVAAELHRRQLLVG
jgi:hypothetical protein